MGVPLIIVNLKKDLVPFFEKYHTDLAAVYLFGSMVDGRTSLNSDIDIAVLLREEDRQKAINLKFQLYPDLCRYLNRNDIDLVVLNLSGNLILKDQIVRHGQCLYVGDSDLQQRFELNILHQCVDFKFQRQHVMGA